MAKKSDKPVAFEASLEELESIVQKMEEESLPLEELLSNYERGHQLLSHCQNLIENARKRIEVVQLERAKSAEETENKLASEATTSDNPSSEAKSDDIRLL